MNPYEPPKTGRPKSRRTLTPGQIAALVIAGSVLAQLVAFALSKFNE